MDYQDIKTAFETIALKHKQVKSFDFGDSWETSIDGQDQSQYPQIYFETPILGSITEKRKTYQFGLVCFIYNNTESYIKEDHFANVSKASKILDEIMTKFVKEYGQGRDGIILTYPYSNMTFYNATTSQLDGVRLDVEVTVTNTCDIEDQFE